MTKTLESTAPQQASSNHSAAKAAAVPSDGTGAPIVAASPGAGQQEAAGTSPGPDESNGPEVRHLAPALAHCAKVLGSSQHSSRIADVLPLDQGELGFDRLQEAARKFNLKIEISQNPLTLASPLATPLIAILDIGEAIVVEALDFAHDTAKLAVFSGDTVTERKVSIRKLSQRVRPALVYLARTDDRDPHAGAEFVGKSDHWFWSAASRFKGSYAQVIMAGFLVNMLALASPLFIMNVYDRVIPNLTIPTLWALASGVVLALLFDFLLKTLRHRVVDETGRRIDMAVSGRVFDHLLEAKSESRPQSTGVLASYIRDFDNVRDLLTSSTIIAITDAVFVIIFLIVLYIIVGVLVLVPVTAAIVVIGVTLWVQVPMSKAMASAQSDSARRHGILIETLLSLDMIKRIGGASHLRRRFDHSVAEASRSSTATRFWSNLNTTVVQSASQAVSVILIVWGVFLVIDGQVSVGALIAANILSGRVLAPLASIAGTLARVQQAKYSYNSVDRLMGLPSEWTDAVPTRPLTAPSLVFDAVSYTYPEQAAPALSDLSFKLEPGERFGIIGRIGSGKSTIGKLLSGLASPTSGRLLIDGVDVQQVSPSALRRFVGVVPQEPELISGTLLDNITMGEPMANPTDLDFAVNMAGLEELARNHPLGLSMPISERGSNLSGGQRHGVALAQSLIRRPRILFLDEPTAALDTHAEVKLLGNLERLSNEEGVTILIATHRHSTLAIVDRLLVIDAGALLALGPKKKVMDALQKQAKTNEAMARAAQSAGLP